MLSNTVRCLQLYLLVTTLGVTCQGQSNNTKAPQISGNSFPSYLVYNADMKGTSPIKKRMQLENPFEKQLTENKTKSDKIIRIMPSVKEPVKYTDLKTDINIIKNATPANKLKLSLPKEPISTSAFPVQPARIVKLYELKLGTTPTSKLTTNKKEKTASAQSKQQVPKIHSVSASMGKTEVIFSQIKNPFQPNSTIEQEVKVINKPGSLNNVFRHIHQHMFHHFEDNFAHGGMHHHDINLHHLGGMHHGEEMHHGEGMHHGEEMHHGEGMHHGEEMHHGEGMHHGEEMHHGEGMHHDIGLHHNIGFHHLHGHWPWHMSIQEEHVNGWHHLCHGAMVGHHSVLTNAECVYHKPLPSLRVVRHNLIDKVITLDNSSFITARIIHPKYNDYVHHSHHHGHGHHVGHHNLALLHLHHDLGVRPIGIHGHHHGHGHDHCSTSHHNAVHFISNEECDYHFGGEHIESSHVCAYGLPCDIHHHHGSPLVCSHHGHSPYLVGLSSYQHSCGHHHPTVYERIAPHSDWITSHIK